MDFFERLRFIGGMLLAISIWPLLADELTVDPPVIWDSPCAPPTLPRCVTCPVPLPDGVDCDTVIVDLSNPIYCDGVLSTEEGGVLTAPCVRIQARKIVYTRQMDADPPVFTVYCEGDLLVDYKKRVLVGESLCYDFISQSGTLQCGRTALPPWYIGGEVVELCSNGDLLIQNAYVTTSQGGEQEVDLRAPLILLSHDQQLNARDISFRIKNIPLLSIPKLHLDLSKTYESPVAFTFGWGGYPGSHLGIRYQFLDWHDFKAFARIDAFFGQGVGGGVETQYCPSGSWIEWYTRNYYAHDIAIYDPQRKDRYRFQGTYFDRIWWDTTTVSAVYDFVSDAEMASDYNTEDFELKTADKTQIKIRTQEDFWISRLIANIRVNSFQSVNQQLPGFLWTWHPFEVPGTGIITENIFKAAYLDYKASSDIPHGPDLHAGRIEVRPRFYRPFFLGPVTATPEAAFVGIAYSNSPSGHSVGQAVGDLGLRIETAFSKHFGNAKHVIEPYAHYHFLTAPRSSLRDHYIFTLYDSYAMLNLLRFGMRNSFFAKEECYFWRPLWIDLWANAFFDTHTIRQTIPKGYLDVEWLPFPRLLMGIDSAWNFQKHQVDFYNIRLEWTVSDHFAIGAEYRHRGRFDWRKADFYNFIIESVYTNEELLDSPFSDRRDIALLRFFYRINPDWWTKFNIRYGWHRPPPQKPFTEYKAEVGTTLFQHWRVSFYYESRKSDHRLSFTLKLDPAPLCK